MIPVVIRRVAIILLWPNFYFHCGPSYDPATEYQTALSALNAGDITEAATAADRLEAADPEYPGALLLLGRIRSRQNQFDLAEDHFIAAVNQDPANLDARYWLAETIARDESRSDEALIVLNDLLAKGGGHAPALLLKGLIHEKRDELPEAFETYRRAEREANTLAVIFDRLGDLYTRAKLPEKAEPEYRRARVLAGENHPDLPIGPENESQPDRAKDESR